MRRSTSATFSASWKVGRTTTADTGPFYHPSGRSTGWVAASGRTYAVQVPDPTPLTGQTPTALPSVRARALAFASIVVAGICGGLIGFAFVDLQCDDGCSGAGTTLGALIGAVFAAGGTAIVAVLVLRAMGEWSADDPQRLPELSDFEPDPPR